MKPSRPHAASASASHRPRALLPRVQLFEFNDLGFAPAAVRDTIVESLSRTLEWGRMLEGLAEPFSAFLAEAERASGPVRDVLDLGAGNGGPSRILAKEILRTGRRPPKFILTDLHPRTSTWEKMQAELPDAIAFEPVPVDATNIPPHLAEGRVRSIINVLHHFPPELAQSILADAVQGSRGVFIAEAFDRNPLQFANFALFGVPALLANPALSPRDKWAKALLTWMTPAAIAISLWDGIVSTLRVYTEAELRAMVAPFGGKFTWTYGTYSYFPFGTGYFFYGVPAGEG